jgi:hypothetical protein
MEWKREERRVGKRESRDMDFEMVEMMRLEE